MTKDGIDLLVRSMVDILLNQHKWSVPEWTRPEWMGAEISSQEGASFEGPLTAMLFHN